MLDPARGLLVGPAARGAPGCNPLVGDDCLTPFPSSFFEVADATTATGVRVALGPATLPLSASGVALSPIGSNQKDGFSPATPFVVYFKAGVDATQLPTLDTLDAVGDRDVGGAGHRLRDGRARAGLRRARRQRAAAAIGRRCSSAR